MYQIVCFFKDFLAYAVTFLFCSYGMELKIAVLVLLSLLGKYTFCISALFRYIFQIKLIVTVQVFTKVSLLLNTRRPSKETLVKTSVVTVLVGKCTKIMQICKMYIYQVLPLTRSTSTAIFSSVRAKQTCHRVCKKSLKKRTI